MTTRVIVNGAQGKMGQEAVRAIEQDSELLLVGKAGRNDNLSQLIEQTKADVVVDFTNAAVAFENTKQIIAANARPVIGTSGLLPEQVHSLQQFAKEKRLGGIIAPNFSIGAILMMRYAQDAIKYFPHAEIIEMHHDNKLDSPSGTAIKTAHLLEKNRREQPIAKEEKEILPNARGAEYENIHIHAIRLPGLVAHQEILFGGCHELLTIRHDSFQRTCFMPGVILSCKKVLQLKELMYGLETIID